MTVKISGSSRLRFSRLITLDGVEHWEMPEYPEILPANDDIVYTVDSSDRIDNLSNRFYSTPILWWIIAIANDFELLPNDMVPGNTIRIPSARRVFGDILRKKQRGTVV